MIETAIAVASFVGGALGAVVAIRVELRYLRRDVREAKTLAQRAHVRIDNLLVK